MGAGWHCRRLLSLLAKGAGTKLPSDIPQKAGGQMEPPFHQADSALSSECAEGVTPADSNKQVGSRGERKTRQDGEAIFVSKNIPERNVMLASESWESEFQKANEQRSMILVFFLFSFSQGHSVACLGLSFLLCGAGATCTDCVQPSGG